MVAIPVTRNWNNYGKFNTKLALMAGDSCLTCPASPWPEVATMLWCRSIVIVEKIVFQTSCITSKTLHFAQRLQSHTMVSNWTMHVVAFGRIAGFKAIIESHTFTASSTFRAFSSATVMLLIKLCPSNWERCLWSTASYKLQASCPR